MDISKFFIDRPIFAGVISFLIFIAGLISIPQLPVSEYPDVVPPSVVVKAQYPGANPKVTAETVAAPLEEQINGVENMLYMYSQATSDGQLQLTVTFKIGTDPDKAQQLVENRVSQALPRLPDIVRQFGVTTLKSSPDLTMVVHLISPDSSNNMLYLRNYAVLNVKDRLARINGVGQVALFGSGDYAMRVWLNPEKLAARNLMASDVTNAIREQNIQVAAGVVGGPPYPNGTTLQLSVNAHGRLQDEQEFGEIIVKSDDNGAITRLKDIATIELGASDYSLRSLLDNNPAVAIPIFQAPGANAIQVSNDVRAAMEELKKDFPAGVDYSIVYDPTVFVRDSIKAVIHTLLEAIALVVLVVIVFLQTWRASIIPLLAVPVSVVGTFAVMHLFGFSINALSLFGLVLAIGIVVDDAIVVVENVERNIENGLSPRDATYQAMREVSGPIIAIALTLIAVFVPIAFISGLTGQFYRQFALTIAISTIISAFNSLTLSPALAAVLLKGHDEPKDKFSKFIESIFGGFFKWFNGFFLRSATKYSRGVTSAIHHKAFMLTGYCILVGLTFFMFSQVPQGFVPLQDKQYLVSFAVLPDGATLDRTEAVMKQMSDIILHQEGVEGAVEFPGLSINGFTNSPSAGIVFVKLKPFDERTTPNLSGGAIAGALNGKLAGIQEAFILTVPPPPVTGLGTIGGFKMQIEDRGDLGYEALNNVVNTILMKARMRPELNPYSVFSGYGINVPQLMADLDRTKAKQMGVSITDVFDTMQIYLGSLYINDFNKFGRTYQVIAQAEAPYRAHAQDILQLKTRNKSGEMVPLGALMKINESYGPDSASRYNAYRTADINGGPNVGFSSVQAQNAIVEVVKQVLPKGMTFEWTELTYQQILSGDTATFVFPLCVLLVFLVLAAQYESMTLPLAVILIVPMCLLSAITGIWIADHYNLLLSHLLHFPHTGKDNNIFTQIGLIVLVGLACKNAILIVEFARELEMQGRKPVEAAIESCRLRLRPILMTSFAFIMGVIPLVYSSGAGSEMRNAMGLAVFSGMLGVTFFGLFLTPVFYVILRYVAAYISGSKTPPPFVNHHLPENGH